MKSIATWIEENALRHFEKFFAGSGFRLWNARVEDVPWGEVKGLLLSGGSDVSVEFLRQEISDPAHIHNPNSARDRWEFSSVSHALGKGLPVFAICRGHQVLNVALGGTLHLDIPGHNLPEQKYGDIQELDYDSSVTLRFPFVNSSHHQAIGTLAPGLVAEAWHAGDGVIEQVRMKNYPFCLGVQYHPERGAIYRPLFEAFIRQVK